MWPHRGSRARSYQATLRDLRSEAAEIRAQAANEVSAHAAGHRPEVVAALQEALSDAHVAVVRAAALALADCQAHESVPALLALLDQDSAPIHEAALSALGEIGDARALPAIEQRLADEAAAVRFQAVMAFTRVSADEERVTQVLLDATEDPDPLVCHIALRMAEERGSGRADDAVEAQLLDRAEVLLEHDSAVVRLAAAIMLARSGRAGGRALLIATADGSLRTSEADDEAEAIELCGRLRLRRATAGLKRRAFSGLLRQDRFAWQSRTALAALGHPRAVRWLLRELGAWTYERRVLAVAAATRARLPQTRSLLEAMRGKEDRAPTEAVEEALRALAEPRDVGGEVES